MNMGLVSWCGLSAPSNSPAMPRSLPSRAASATGDSLLRLRALQSGVGNGYRPARNADSDAPLIGGPSGDA